MKCMQNACEYREQFTNNGGIFQRFDLTCTFYYYCQQFKVVHLTTRAYI